MLCAENSPMLPRRLGQRLIGTECVGSKHRLQHFGQTENPRVGGSIPPLAPSFPASNQCFEVRRVHIERGDNKTVGNILGNS